MVFGWSVITCYQVFWSSKYFDCVHCLNLDSAQSALEAFLFEDSQSSIRKPAYSFKVAFPSLEILGHPNVKIFLEKYGQQIRHLQVSCLSFFHMGISELEFYRNIPNLRSLIVDQEFIRRRRSDNPNDDVISVPETFRRLKFLQIPPLRFNLHLRVIDFCKHLECFGFSPFNRSCPPDHFNQLCEILERQEHTRFVSHDLNGLYLQPGAVSDLCRMATTFDVKLLNMNHNNLALFERFQRDHVAPQILSISCLWRNRRNFRGFQFPNCHTIEITFPSTVMENQRAEVREVIAAEMIAEVRRGMSRRRFPSLKKLVIISLNSPNAYTCVVNWLLGFFPTLEELEFRNCAGLNEATFFGVLERRVQCSLFFNSRVHIDFYAY